MTSTQHEFNQKNRPASCLVGPLPSNSIMSLAAVPGDFHAQRSQLPSRLPSAVECRIRLLVTPYARNNDMTHNPVEPEDENISVIGITLQLSQRTF